MNADKIIKALRETADWLYSKEDDCYAKPVSDAANLIEQQAVELAALREAGRWIPVSERLPDPGEMVLALADGVCHRFDRVPLDYTVTHWMPLPAAPERKGCEVRPPVIGPPYCEPCKSYAITAPGQEGGGRECL